jgi:molecular chaperone GrpE (heat shock protein)
MKRTAKFNEELKEQLKEVRFDDTIEKREDLSKQEDFELIWARLSPYFEKASNFLKEKYIRL